MLELSSSHQALSGKYRFHRAQSKRRLSRKVVQQTVYPSLRGRPKRNMPVAGLDERPATPCATLLVNLVLTRHE